MKGKILERIVQKILLSQGYERLNEDDPKFDSSTGKFEGRGADHELDAFGQYKHSIPFVHPIRLFGEAKCYKANYSVGVDIIREAITVQKDIDENYESRTKDIGNDRRIECFAVFSTSGFSPSATMLARAHGIYLVPLGHLRTIVDEINDRYKPSTHEGTKKAVNTYFQENSTLVHFASFPGGYPIALEGALPKERLSHSDFLYASAVTKQSETSNAIQFDIQNSKTDPKWKLTTEIPVWMVDNATDQTNEEYLSLIVPTQLSELTRHIRIEIPREDFQPVF
ncbi:restriction endonuclease [Saliphagus sp. LR7]|uniref:restriction endonuclease n=1 Tax=Saliphagus sp. LR7 TaxID=2282654 RepID=UPI000DF7E365|nr:restriction endonuclease [Saliphagus sp. LR7]